MIFQDFCQRGKSAICPDCFFFARRRHLKKVVSLGVFRGAVKNNPFANTPASYMIIRISNISSKIIIKSLFLIPPAWSASICAANW